MAHRKLTFDSAQVTLILLKSSDPVPTGESNGKDNEAVNGNDHPNEIVILSAGTSNLNGQRQSRRIRENKDRGRRKKVEIQKAMTVKDIKVLVSSVTVWHVIGL